MRDERVAGEGGALTPLLMIFAMVLFELGLCGAGSPLLRCECFRLKFDRWSRSDSFEPTKCEEKAANGFSVGRERRTYPNGGVVFDVPDLFLHVLDFGNAGV